ncbi:hypothetical protein D3C87_1392030 [compost metagenome]
MLSQDGHQATSTVSVMKTSRSPKNVDHVSRLSKNSHKTIQIQDVPRTRHFPYGLLFYKKDPSSLARSGDFQKPSLDLEAPSKTSLQTLGHFQACTCHLEN